MSENCSVLVNSCDKYEDAWYPFFELLKIYWKDCPYAFYLNTEKKHYVHDGFDIVTLNCNDEENLHWGARTKSCLDRINTKYVIVLLEDFFMQQPVRQDELNRCIELMEKNNDISAIYFKTIDGFTEHYPETEGFYSLNENKRYKLNLQAGLWRTDILNDLIQDEDSPWSFEFEGADRTGSNQIFLCTVHGSHTDMHDCVFPYLTSRKLGYGIWAGKWLWNNDRLFERNGIHIPSVSIPRFSRWDMKKYYVKRFFQKIGLLKVEG